MMVAEIEADQFSLFPKASKRDISRARVYLTEYTEMMRGLADFERNPPKTEKQCHHQKLWSEICPLLIRAVNQIIEYDVREVVEYRFIKGNSRAATILRFSGWDCCDKTIDRKIYDGIVSVANSLMYLE